MPENTFAVSMNCYTWGKFNVAECIEHIKQTPIRMLELPAAQYRPGSLIPELMLDESVGGKTGWQYSISDFKVLLAADGFKAESVDVFGRWKGEKGKQIIRNRIDFAADVGAETVVLGVGQETDKERRQFFYALIREMADYAAPKGLRIALEVHGGIMANSAEMLRTMEEVGRGNVGINFDTANILHYNREGDGVAELEAAAKHVTHVHIKDIIRDNVTGKFSNPVVGAGEVDFREVFDILHAVDFYGPFSFEVETFNSATDTEDIRDYHEDLLMSIEHIRSLGEFHL